MSKHTEKFGYAGLLLVFSLVCLLGSNWIEAEEVHVDSNIVGFKRQTVVAGLQLMSNPYAGASNDITGVVSNNLPVGSKIWFWDRSTMNYVPVEYQEAWTPGGIATNWSDSLPVSSTDGFWVDVPAGSGTTNFSVNGNVPSANAVTNSIRAGLSLVGYPYPVDTVVSNLNISPSLGDKVWVWDCSATNYTPTEYQETWTPGGMATNWSDGSLTIEMGAGFWYEANDDIEWVEPRPYNL